MLKVGVTGNIGSGKSIICDMFNAYGIPIYNADLETRNLMETNDEIIRQVKKEFGEQSYLNNKLNRPYISQIVFSDAHKLQTLNAITHPKVIEHAQKWMDKQTTPYTIKEAALIFESGSAKGLDIIIGVAAPLSIRIQRVMKRDGLSREDIMKRMDKQMDQDIKMKLCDIVIYNNDNNYETLKKQVDVIHHRLLNYKE